MDKKGWDGKIEKDTLAESSAQVMGLKKEAGYGIVYLVYGRRPSERLEDLLAEDIPDETEAKRIAGIAKKNGWLDVRISKVDLGTPPDFTGAVKKEDVATSLFDKNSAQDFTAYLKNELMNRYPDMYVKFTRAPLGDNSVVLYASLEPKETWSNGIFENSDYFIMEIYTDGTMEKTLTSFYQKGKRFGKDSRVKVSFPRQKAVNREDIVKRLFKFIDNAKKAIDVEIG